MHFFIRNRFIRNFVVGGLKIKKLFRLVIKREAKKEKGKRECKLYT